MNRRALAAALLLSSLSAALVAQGPGLVRVPCIEGIQQRSEIDEVILKRQEAEQQVAIGVGLGHRR